MQRFADFPPFYTAQPHKETRDKQIDLWCKHTLHHCKQHRLYTLPPPSDAPWHNHHIKRTIQPDLHAAVLARLSRDGTIEPIQDNQHLVWWASADELAQDLLAVAGTRGAILTAFELFYERGAAFEGMPEGMYMRVLRGMQDRGLAALIEGAGRHELGIKFTV